MRFSLHLMNEFTGIMSGTRLTNYHVCVNRIQSLGHKRSSMSFERVDKPMNETRIRYDQQAFVLSSRDDVFEGAQLPF